MPSKELAAQGAGRDLGAELQRSIRELKAGKLSVVQSPAAEARQKAALAEPVRGAAGRLGAHTAGLGAGARAAQRRRAHAAGDRADESEGAAGRRRAVAPQPAIARARPSTPRNSHSVRPSRPDWHQPDSEIAGPRTAPVGRQVLP